MAKITEDLIRKRSEHNNCEITTLEELSLHQQDIEKIEHLDKWCRDLKILYLQSNLIPKIENVSRLKKLEYLNLALNNITKIENLQGCESLQKLDLTVNFVGDLLSVETLKENEHFTELFLTGNPCTDYEGYRDFVIATLPHLKWLDGREISRSERIKAVQRMPELRSFIYEQQVEYEKRKERERLEEEEKERNKHKPGFNSNWYTDPTAHLPKEKQQKDVTNEDKYMTEPVSYTPESRVELHKHLAEKRKDNTQHTEGPQVYKRERRLERDGVMLNVNEGRYDFQLIEDEDNNQFVLDVSCPRFMDTSLIDCEIYPKYVRVTIKNKILQLTLQDEVSPDQSSAKRSQTTGHLLVTMPKVKDVIKVNKKIPVTARVTKKSHLVNDVARKEETNFLEVPEPKGLFDIVKERKEKRDETVTVTTGDNDDEPFIDNPDVPPLI